ncbi:MAG: peptidoglycan DD-metalloendopeptidase family protein [Erysipelotrichaceae bacterium]|nr:peptidoglycan DD-metalloendopeptidase family protein [Erysipelotrichaceae bacterium]
MYIIEKRRRTAIAGIGLSLAVLAVSAMYYQQQKTLVEDTPVFQMQETILTLPVVEAEELIEVPMLVNANQVMNYYDSSKSEGELMHALTHYEGVYRPSQSVCYSMDGKVFEVTAMVSGTVSEVYTDELMGKSVAVDVGNGLVITYQSLSNVQVIPGQMIQQFEVLGLASENKFHEDLGIHVQITAHKDGQLIDPEQLIHQKVSEIN